MEQAAKEYEQETGIRVTLGPGCEENQMTQNSQAERMIGLNCDVLCVNMVDRSAASGVIDKAIEADTPIVFFNREPVSEDMKRWEKLYYVGADAKESAVLEGRSSLMPTGRIRHPLTGIGDGVVSYVLLEGDEPPGFPDPDGVVDQTLRTAVSRSGGSRGGIANWEETRRLHSWKNGFPITGMRSNL